MNMKALTDDYAVVLIEEPRCFRFEYRVNKRSGEYLILQCFEKDKYEVKNCDCLTVNSKPYPFNQRIIVNVFEPKKGKYHLFCLQPVGKKQECCCSNTNFKKSNQGFYYTDGFLYDPKTERKLAFYEDFDKKAIEKGVLIEEISLKPLNDDEKYFLATFSLENFEPLAAVISTLNPKQFKLLSCVYSESSGQYVPLTPEKKWLTVEEFLEKLLQSPLADEIKIGIQNAKANLLAKTRKIQTELRQIIKETEEE